MRRFGFVQPPHATLAILALSTCLVSAQGGQTAPAQPPAQTPAQPPPPQPQGRGTQAPAPPMSFFITSTPIGKGGNLGGLAGADAHCQTLAAAAGAGEPDVARLSEHAGPGCRECARPDRQGAVGQREGAVDRARPGAPARRHARPRAHGQHVDRATALNEKGEQVPGPPFPGAPAPAPANLHDILTGSQLDGRAYTDSADHTCNNWTSEDAGSAQVGHHDRDGRARDLLEFGARQQGMQPAGAHLDRRSRPALLLRHRRNEVTGW